VPVRAGSDAPLVGYARGVAGGLIAGLPLLYTMEVWWLGETAEPSHVLVVLAFTMVPVAVLVLAGGFRRDERPRGLDVVVDTTVALGLGVATCAVVLLAIGQLQLDMSAVRAAETVVVQAAPFALGAAVAAQVFRPDEDGGRDDAPEGAGDRGSSSSRATARDLGATATGALFFGMAIAPTEEIPLITASLSAADAALLVLLSLAATYLIVFVAGFADQEARRAQVGALQHPLTETVAAYVTTLVVALCMLWVFDNLTGDPITVLVETVVLGLPAGVGGAAGRVVV